MRRAPVCVPHSALLAAASALLLTVGCSLPSSAPSPAGTANPSANLQFCTDEINRYRASVGRPPLARSGSLESFATQAAQHDATAGVPHLLFSNTNGGGVARAETELLLWRNYAVRDVIRQGLAQMWSTGPDGEHYNILAGPYSEVGCGVFVNGGEVSIAQDFK
jgi:uncharacterized protein YkwD